jgi:ATP-dependent helicase/nuclease subunit A
MAKGPASKITPPDREKREQILSELDSNILVEAAAGTGKTTSMVGRMLALLSTGKCADIRTLAAVTFTRKAAAELRGRFLVELEKAVREAAGEERERLEEALNHVEQCFIGTIHSFCGRLLRERPVEAGLDLAFEEIDEDADKRLREEAWETFTIMLTAHDPDGFLAELHRLGLRLPDLKDSFLSYADFPDVELWPCPEMGGELPGMGRALSELQAYITHMAELAAALPRDCGNDELIPEYKRLPRIFSHYHDLDRPDQLIEILELFDKNRKVVQKVWKADGVFSKEDALGEKARWDHFRDEVVRPNLLAWRELRYGTVLSLLGRAREVYDEMRRERSQLNFQDLLIQAARLLRDNPNVRRYFQGRFTHLLVDEFQDTDPIQAEVILLLASCDPEETNWRRCVPRPGSLFVVGDPKQSIYRFRRADIVSYNEVKEIIRRGGCQGGKGSIVELSANFRAAEPVISWVNRVFEPGQSTCADQGSAMLRFPEEADESSPSYKCLSKGREDGCDGELSGLYGLHVPEQLTRKEQVIDYEADLIARIIRWALDSGVTVPRTRQQVEAGRPAEVDPSDFMIITYNKPSLGVYARKLQEYDIPHRVTGGGVLNEVGALKLLYDCLRAVVHPDDPVSLVAALRGELFGLSDADLYAFKKEGGVFSYHVAIPGSLSPQTAEIFRDAFDRLKLYSLWFSVMPAPAALERMVADLGLGAYASSRPGGDVEAGSLYKALELVRAAQPAMWSMTQIVDYLGRLTTGEERHDGISACSGERPAVRIMNLHKVKGLEAPVVFLANPSGEFDHDIERHIDRSGDQILGYLAVRKKGTGKGRSKTLALPVGWDLLEERERGFIRAEDLRLRYVAATRSAAATLITQRASGNKSNPWGYFADDLRDAPSLPDPGLRTAPPQVVKALAPREAADAAGAISLRLDEVGKPTYDTLGAKEYALSQPPDAISEGDVVFPDSKPGTLKKRVEGEYGLEWGTVIHQLLQAGMENPHADLDSLAAAVLASNDLDAGLVNTAVEYARSVMASGIWRRALDSAQRYIEVPFQVLLEQGMPVPTVVRGVIDLIFREDGGWVMVDYKTDNLEGEKSRYLVEKYSPQARLYAQAWERCTGEPIKATFLYFIHGDLLVEIH